MWHTLNTGEVTSIVGDQVVVKSASLPPAIGTAVYGEKGRVGTVSDIIGPLSKPYFVVKPAAGAKIKEGDVLRGGPR
jgi:rRNA processing protein Gar1